mmetsp:Transcript_49562/g.126281  ORF Transcript_49562/g.126281 Transcript_49562/m.126281 type:complete len:122 (-) Transcript_49562:14-379(-)
MPSRASVVARHSGQLTEQRRLQRKRKKARMREEKALRRKSNNARWRNASHQPPSAVQEYASNEFIRLLRDGGPQAVQAEDLPEVDMNWIGRSPTDTAVNVVNGLCFHRFGEEIYAESVEQL